MNRVLAVFRKEVLDNFRDKRTLFFAFLYGPLLLPLLMVGPIAIGISKHSIDFDKSLTDEITNRKILKQLKADYAAARKG